VRAKVLQLTKAHHFFEGVTDTPPTACGGVKEVLSREYRVKAKALQFLKVLPFAKALHLTKVLQPTRIPIPE
jgi:hypothetical protein